MSLAYGWVRGSFGGCLVRQACQAHQAHQAPKAAALTAWCMRESRLLPGVRELGLLPGRCPLRSPMVSAWTAVAAVCVRVRECACVVRRSTTCATVCSTTTTSGSTSGTRCVFFATNQSSPHACFLIVECNLNQTLAVCQILCRVVSTRPTT
jgi:hypothetical protein